MSNRDSGGYRRTWIDHTSDVHASARDVYELLADVDGWPRWVPGVTAVQRPGRGKMAVGDRFTFMLKPASFHPPLPIPCRLLKLEPTLIEWGGGIPGSVARHSFALNELGPKRTRVRQIVYATNLLALVARIAEPGIYKHDLRMQNALGEYLAAQTASTEHRVDESDAAAATRRIGTT